jgi:hypothetical protein
MGFSERLDSVSGLTVLDGPKRNDLVDAERVPLRRWGELNGLADLKRVLAHDGLEVPRNRRPLHQRRSAGHGLLLVTPR